MCQIEPLAFELKLNLHYDDYCLRLLIFDLPLSYTRALCLSERIIACFIHTCTIHGFSWKANILTFTARRQNLLTVRKQYDHAELR